jgi:hypothetical protein|tara:strand:- start:370 stop:951 length:582 start_codon:yes stop_codon:yes gene_type:complete
MKAFLLLLGFCAACIVVRVDSYSFSGPRLLKAATKIAAGLGLGLALLNPSDNAFADSKLRGVKDEFACKLVADDITLRQALITADFSRDLYSESATFKDEIDTYRIDQYIKGTKALFNPKKSHVDLVGDVSVIPDSNTVTFKFSETLSFNIPFNPRVSLTGYVELFRDSEGIITKSVEHWDQSVFDVLKTAKF